MSKQSEIARQFDLPERQSKLNTILREEGLRDEQVYCICRSSDVSRFMIGCDYCEEWYHGDCISVTEHEANKIRKFYCKRCRHKHPSLQIKYKEKKSHRHHKHHEKEKHNKHDDHKKEREQSTKNIKSTKHDKKCGECEACYIREDCGRCENCKDMTKFGGTGKLNQRCKKRQCQNFFHLAKKHNQMSSLKTTSEKKAASDRSRSDHSYNSQSKPPKVTNSANSSSKTTEHHASGNPESGVARVMPSLSQFTTKHSSTTTNNSSSGNNNKNITSTSSTSHSTSVSTSFTSITTSSYTSTSNATFTTTLPAKKAIVVLTKEALVSSSHPQSTRKPLPALPPPSSSVTSFSNSIVSIASGDSSSNKGSGAARDLTPSPLTVPVPAPTPVTPPVCSSERVKSTREEREEHVLVNTSNLISHADDTWETTKKRKTKESVVRKRKEGAVGRKRKSQEAGSDSDDPWDADAAGPRHCLGPHCIKAAKPASKYCSELCGLKLAEARIYSVLPQRIQEWKMTPCVAEDRDRQQLEKIRAQQLEARKALQALDEKHKELDASLERWKSVSIDPQADEEGDEEGSEGAYVYCVTCGHEIPTRRAIKHMHSCYNKLESQMSFGSMFKTRIEGNNMFCDSYNSSNRTYCKRLRVMCPEHTKESKISNTEVCGFPLTEGVFSETGKVCRMSKKKCVRHYCWEKLRRASIDMERVRQCLKLDELVEQERQVRLAMTNRAGVLGLMLHSTYYHGYDTKVQNQQKKQRSSDHQYHQKEKTPSKDSHGKLKDSTNYHSHHHHQINTDHHYHRQQPEAGQEPYSKHMSSQSTKKYRSKYATSSSSAATSSSHNYPKQSQHGPAVTPATKSANPSPYIYQSDNQFSHDHQYFSNQPTAVDDRSHDHVYYSSKRFK